MKKLFLVLTTAILAFTACSSDNDKETVDPVDPTRSPIEGLLLPTLAEGELFKGGNELNIKGKGFTEVSEIWFKATESTTDAIENDIQAEVKEVSAEGIIVIAPEVYGEQELLLVQDKGSYSLGKLIFGEKIDVKVIKQLKGAFSKNSDVYTFDFQYAEDNKLTDLTISYPFFRDTRVLDFKIYYNDNNTISRITSQIKGKKVLMGDGIVTYPSAKLVTVDKIDVKKYNYTLNETAQLTMATDSRGDKVDKFAYDADGNMIEYTEIDYGRPQVAVKLSYDNEHAFFAAINLPSWAWHFIMTDVLSGNAYMYSFFSPSNATTVDKVAYTYEYNDANQPISIQVDGKEKGSASYND